MVEDAGQIRVKFQDGREFDAKVKGRDPQSDVAVIEIKAGGLPALRLADSSALEVGEWVVAIGNPFGLSQTLTVGVVSATGRTSVGINDYEDFIQTDAAINPGNSGGPLVNLDGEVVGMNTAIFSRSGGYMGVGFAIPINLASAIANQLIESRRGDARLPGHRDPATDARSGRVLRHRTGPGHTGGPGRPRTRRRTRPACARAM